MTCLVLLASALEARAVQASGALMVLPADFGFLSVGDLIDVVISIENGSSDSPATDEPGDGFAPVPATLDGTVSLTIGCSGPGCSHGARGALSFVAVGPNGCSGRPEVVRCSSDGRVVRIELADGGLVLPPAAVVDLATVRLAVDKPFPGRSIELVASTQDGGMRACSSSDGAICAAGIVEGGSVVLFGGHAAVGGKGVTRLRFRTGLDTLDLALLLGFEGSVDFAASDFSLTLSNAQGVIGSCTLPAGRLTLRGSYSDPGAARNGGFGKLKIGGRRGEPNTFKIDIRCFGDFLRATLPVMTLDLTIAAEGFRTTNTWTQAPYGWVLSTPR